MKTLKWYVKNQSIPQSCIIERYIVEETLDFCTGYFVDCDFIGIPMPRYAERTFCKGITGNQILATSRTKMEQAQLYVLHNADEVKNSNPSKNANWISREHNQCFIKWLKNHIFEELNINAH
ncbi:hypothetical protein Lal_00016782 [Lupinus albus]|nr:hypothetical protein Lal_00016782 [Lupinus albus]